MTGLSGASGSTRTWTIEVPAGANNLVVKIAGGSGDADLYVRRGSPPTTTSYDCRPYLTGNNETCTFASPQSGTWYVMLRGYSAFSGVTLTASYQAGSGGTQTYTNSTDYPINDHATVESPITVSGRSGNAPSNTPVAVDIRHTYRADLKVDLVAPDGSVYVLHNRTGGSADNIIGTYTVNLSSEPRNGTWRLRVNDNWSGDTGYINSWSITF
nr:pre-peptidase C-terminal domain-containing protein [Luteimonas sp. J29]